MAHNPRMRIVYRAENLVDAHLVKDVLDQAGIPAPRAAEAQERVPQEVGG